MLEKYSLCFKKCNQYCAAKLLNVFLNPITYNSFYNVCCRLIIIGRDYERPYNTDFCYSEENNQFTQKEIMAISDSYFCEREFFIFNKFLKSKFGIHPKYRFISFPLDDFESEIERVKFFIKQPYYFSKLPGWKFDFEVVGILNFDEAELSDLVVSSIPVF